MQDVYILSPVSGLYSTRSAARTHRCMMAVITLTITLLMMALMTTPLSPFRDELGLMSCDDISRYSVSSQSGSKGSEAVSYYLDQDSGQFFSLLEGDGPPGPDYDRGRNTGVRRRDKTPTHGKTEGTVEQCEWGSNGCIGSAKTACSLPPVFSSFFLEPLALCSSLTSCLRFFLFPHAHVPKKHYSHATESVCKTPQLPVCPTTCVTPV